MSPVTRNPAKETSWAKPRSIRAEIAAFFSELSAKKEVKQMHIKKFTAQGDRVVVEGNNKGIVRATGKAYEHDWVMIFDLRDGQIV